MPLERVLQARRERESSCEIGLREEKYDTSPFSIPENGQDKRAIIVIAAAIFLGNFVVH
jgi:hypothetical protein